MEINFSLSPQVAIALAVIALVFFAMWKGVYPIIKNRRIRERSRGKTNLKEESVTVLEWEIPMTKVGAKAEKEGND